MTDRLFSHVVVLLNPASAAGAAWRRWRAVAPLAARLLPGLEVIESSAPGDLRLAAAAEAGRGRATLLLAAGGDGTSHEVLNGLIDAGDTAAAMGWLPIGSGNDLARSVGVPLDARKALHWYRRPVISRIDAGTIRYRVEGRPAGRAFGNSFTVGLSTDTLELVRHGRRFGGLSYLGATLQALARQAPLDLELEIDGVRRSVPAARLLSVTNGASFGAGMRVTPGARLDDGRLDLVWIAGISRAATLMVFPRIYWGGHLTHPAVHSDRLERLVIHGDGIRAFEVDGELIPVTGPIELGIRPGALRIARGRPDYI